MALNKKHFFTLIAINSLLPLLFIFIKGADEESWVVLIFSAIVAVISFAVFFVCWILYFIVTGGKEPLATFHLVPQYLITVSILCVLGYAVYFYNYQDNIRYNKEFLANNGNNKGDTLPQKAFVLLENEIANKNDIQLHSFSVSKQIDTTIDNFHDELSLIKFTYTLKSDTTIYGSEHLVGKKLNKLLLYNIPVSFFRDMRFSLYLSPGEEENNLTELLRYYNERPGYKRDKKAIELIKAELTRLKLRPQ